MKTKFNGILTLLLALVVQLSFAQERTISGIVSDESGPLPGVSVLKKGTTKGTETDFDGKYSIKAKTGDVLVFSFVGATSEKTVGSSNTLNVSLTSNVLDEVVVTALGIKSKPRELVSSVQTVKSDEIENANEANIATALASKAAGVQVTSSSGAVGSSANIRVRGNTSINRTNSPLFVVDGVPIDNSSANNGTGGVANSNRAIDINQNDIESISILKGIAAQTLYGLRASNGVVLITTKSGREGKPKVNISSNVSFSEINRFPELQKKYAQGRPVGGVPTWRGPETREGFSWGPEISSLEFDGDSSYPYDVNGRLVPAGTGNGVAAKAYDNNTFFKTGIQTDLNVSVSGGGETARYFISGGMLDGSGVSPTENFKRNSFRVNLNSKLSEKLSAAVSGTFVNSGGRRVQRGSNISGIMLGLLRTTPTFDNGNGLTGSQAAANPNTYVLPDGSQRSYRAGVYDNPYWTVAKNPTTDDVFRMIGNIQLDYQINDWLGAQAKYGIDRFDDVRKIGVDVGSATNSAGSLTDWSQNNLDITTQFLLLANKDFSDKLNGSLTVGVDNFSNKRLTRFTTGNTLTIPGFFHVSNSASQNSSERISRRKLTGILSNLTLGYDDMLFLNTSFRNDWSSTLPEDNNSFQSYSIGGSFVFSELLGESSWFDYGKLRGSWGKSGNDAPIYSTDTYYNAAVSGGDGFIGNNNFPIFSTVAFERGARLGNANIVPETTTEFEVGAEFKFFNNRINLDVAYYDKKTEDQIIFIAQPATTGFTSRVENAGIITNKGIEVTLNTTPVKTENFSWDADFNFTSMENKVEKLAEGVPPIILSGFTSTSSRIVEGESYGAIYGGRWLRNDNGDILVDDNGLAIQDPNNGVIGDPIPDFTLGIRNTFKYRGLSLTALLDIREGGDVWCGTCGILDYFGVSKKTGELRDQSYVVNGVRQSDGQPNTTEVKYADPAGGLGANRWVRYGFGGVSEDNVYDGSFIKLREVALSYSFPTKILDPIGLKAASVTFAGRNLWLSTDYPGIDPETNLTGASNGIGLDYFNQPQTQSYSLGVNLSF